MLKQRETESCEEAIDFGLSALRDLVRLAESGAEGLDAEERAAIDKGGAPVSKAGEHYAAAQRGAAAEEELRLAARAVAS